MVESVGNVKAAKRLWRVAEEGEESRDESRASRGEAAERRLESITSGTPVLLGSGPSGTTALPAAEPRLGVGLASRLPACERTALPAPGAWALTEQRPPVGTITGGKPVLHGCGPSGTTALPAGRRSQTAATGIRET